MNQSKAARRYAKAFFELAVEAGCFEELGHELALVSKVMQIESDLLEWLRSPAISRQQKFKVAETIALASHTSPLMTNGLKLLAERGRLAYLPEVERIYAQYADKHAGRMRALVISAIALENEAVQRLGEALSQATRQNVTIERQVDPSILGGVVAQVGSQLFDGSTRNQLTQLKKQLQA